VLDVGCGDGLLTEKMAEHYPRVTGIDGSREKIEVARRRVPAAEFHAVMFEEFEFVETFDSVVMINFLEHVDDPVASICKARSLLAEGGEVVAFVPNALSLNRRLGVAMGIIKNPYELSEADLKVGHRRFYDMNKLAEDFVNGRMIPIEIGGLFLKPLPNAQMKSWSPELREALYVVGGELPEYCGLAYVRAVK